jgi:NAD(P)-dependent dehydrogenase (short-subunit alcohol dehydrogenase family)
VDLNERRIRVNASSPSIVPTPGYNTNPGMTQQRTLTNTFQGASGAIPLDRAGTPEEVAKAVLLLASDDSSYVTGIELFVDAGLAQI